MAEKVQEASLRFMTDVILGGIDALRESRGEKFEVTEDNEKFARDAAEVLMVDRLIDAENFKLWYIAASALSKVKEHHVS